MKRFSVTALFLVIVLCCLSSTEVGVADVGEWSWESLWDCGYVIMAEDYSQPNQYWVAFTPNVYQDKYLFKYDFEQQTWEEFPLPLSFPNMHIFRIYTFPTFPNLLFIGSYRNLYRTTNSGQTWQEVYQAVSPEYMYDLIHYPLQSDSLLMLLISDGTLLTTPDFGDSWNPITHDLPEGYYSMLRAIDDTCGTLFVARDINDTTLYRSSDGGSHWIVSEEGVSGLSQRIYDLFRSSIDTTIYWLASRYGIYRSTDEGWNWTPVGGEVGLADTMFGVVAEDPVDPYHLYAIQHGRRCFYESSDGGGHWQLTTPYLPGTYWGNHVFSRDSISHSGGVLIGTVIGIYRRDDRYSEFEAVAIPPEIPYARVDKMSIGGQQTVWAFNGVTIMRKTLGSNDWFPSNNQLGPLGFGEVLCGDPQSDSIAYAHTLFKTTNAGMSWFPIGDWSPMYHSKAMAINQQNPEHLVLAIIEDRGRVYYSDDRGETFQDITGDLPDVSYRDVLIFDGEPETILLATFGFSDGGIFATTDYGQSWHHRDGNGLLGTMVSRLHFDPRTGYLYKGGSQLWCSPDTGLTWNDCSSGLPGPTGVIVFDPRPDGDSYIIIQIGIGSDECGIFRGDPLIGEWELFFAYSTDTLTLRDLMIDPRPPWTIYANGHRNNQGLLSWTEPNVHDIEPELNIVTPNIIEINVELYPNPFNQECRITVRMETTSSAQTKIIGEIFNILGQSVKKLDFRQASPTSFETLWQGKDTNNIPLSSGIYLVRIAYGNVKTTGKILLLH